MRQYEAMFLFDSSFATNFASVEQEIDRIVKERAEGSIVFRKKWDERKLAYEIGRHKRGCYVLVYFNVDPGKIVGIERDCKLSEHVIRVMITDATEITPEYMENLVIPATNPNRSEREFGDDDRRRDSRRPAESRPAATAAPEAPPAEAPAATATAEPEAATDTGDAPAEEKTEE